MKKLLSVLATLFIVSSLSFVSSTSDASIAKQDVGSGVIEIQSVPKTETGN